MRFLILLSSVWTVLWLPGAFGSLVGMLFFWGGLVVTGLLVFSHYKETPVEAREGPQETRSEAG